MISRRKFFALAAGAAIAPKELLAAPVVPAGAITLEMLQQAYAAAKFDIAYMQADAAMVFEPKEYYDFSFVESPRMMFTITGITIPDVEESDVLA